MKLWQFSAWREHRIYGYEQPPFTQQRTFPKGKRAVIANAVLAGDWDYTLAGLSYINREKIDAIREAVRELEKAGYIQRSRERDEKGRLRGTDYIIYEQPPNLDLPTLENPTLGNPTLENPTQEKPTLENPMQLNKDIQKTDLPKKEKSNTDYIK